jgi:hypothetical protein
MGRKWKMKNSSLAKILLSCLLCSLIVVSACCFSCFPSAKYEKTVRLSQPLAPGSVFAAQTHNGSITVNGFDIADCNITATIVAWAQSEKEAQRIVEESKIKLETVGKTLTVKLEKPILGMNQSVSVDFDVTVPKSTELQLNTHNGTVDITNITANIDAASHNGEVNASKVSGSTKLITHNGSITCMEISGDIELRSHNGSIKAIYSESASNICDVSIITHNGNVDFKAPPNFSSKVEVSTHNGSIKTDLPITVTGEVSKNLSGTIGTGQGMLHLETHNGSIRIR